MTSLIDVIFLLLLFFMLSSTFTRFSEVTLSASGGSGGVPTQSPVFVNLDAATLWLNGTGASLAALPPALEAYRDGAAPITVLVSMKPAVTAQRLTDLLVTLRSVPDLTVTVLEGS